MTAGDGYFAVIAVRPRPASKRRRRFRPALGRTATLPSVPVRSDPGRTGRLTSLILGIGGNCLSTLASSTPREARTLEQPISIVLHEVIRT